MPRRTRWLRRAIDIRTHEWPLVWSLFGAFFLIAALQHLLKPARNAFFLSTAGAENLPWAYIASAGLSVVTTLAYGRWVAPLAQRRQILGSEAVVALSLVLFWALLQAPSAWRAGAFYVWMQVFSLLLVSQFFLIGNDLFDPRQAKRVFGFIGTGGLVGGVAGSAVAGFFAEQIGTANLLLIGAGLLAACIGLMARVFRIRHLDPTEKAGRPSQRGGEGVTGGLRILRRVPHLEMIALLLLVTTLVSTFVDWLFNAAVEQAIPSREDQTEFFGQVFALFNAVALVVQIFVTSLALRTVGLAGSLALLPLAMGAGVAGYFVLPGLLTATLARGADGALRVSVDQSAREILYLPVPRILNQRAKPFIDIVVARGADGLAGVLILIGSGVIAMGGRGFTLLTLGLIVLWFFAVWGVRRTYRRALERLLAVRDVDLAQAAETSLDSTTLREILAQLSPETEAVRVHYALDLLSILPPDVFRDELRELLRHPEPSVRARAIQMLAPAAGGEDRAKIRSLVKDPAGLVRAEAAIVLCGGEPDGRIERIGSWLESEDPYEVEAALTCLLVHGSDEDRDRAGQAVSRLVRRVGDEEAPVRAAVARALGRLTAPHPLQRHLETLLSDGHPDVVSAAIRSAGAVPRKDLLPSLLPLLEPLSTRGAAIRALAAYGEAGIPYLAASLRDPELSPEARRWLPSVFVRIGTPSAFLALAEGLPALTVSTDRLYALKALNKMRRRHPGWEVPTELVREELDVELKAAYEVERQLVALRSGALAREGDGGGDVDRLATALGTYAWALGFQAERTIERAFRLEALLYSPRTIYFAYAGLAGGGYGAHAIELLETALAREDSRRILPLIDPDYSIEHRVEIGRQCYALEDRAVAEDLETILETGEPWLQAYAVPLAGAAFPDALGPDLERLAASGAEFVRPVAREALQRNGDDLVALSSVEKAAALRRTQLLSQLGADDLLQLAAVAEERTFDPGEYLFYEGEEGDYLYIVLDGEIRIEKGNEELARNGPGDTVGTFSILDQQPRSASGVAVGATRTLAIHRADLAQILSDNYSLVEGLFKHLTAIIRDMNERVLSAGEPPSSEQKK